MIDAMFYYYIGFWIVLAAMGRDGEPLDIVDVAVVAVYPIMYTVVMPYCILRDIYEGN